MEYFSVQMSFSISAVVLHKIHWDVVKYMTLPFHAYCVCKQCCFLMFSFNYQLSNFTRNSSRDEIANLNILYDDIVHVRRRMHSFT